VNLGIVRLQMISITQQKMMSRKLHSKEKSYYRCKVKFNKKK